MKPTRDQVVASVADMLRNQDKARQMVEAFERAVWHFRMYQQQQPDTPRLRTAADALAREADTLAARLLEAPPSLESYANQGAVLSGLAPVYFLELRGNLERLAAGLRVIRDDVPERTLPQHKKDARNRMIAMLARDYERITGKPAGYSRTAIFTRLVAILLTFDGPHLGSDSPDSYFAWIKEALRQQG